MRSIPATAEPSDGDTLRLEGLSVTFSTPDGDVEAVRDLSLAIRPGECLGVVGESGAGKSQAFLATLGLLASNGRVRGHAYFGSADLLGLSRRQLDGIRGSQIGMVFQDPMTSLTPHISVGDQIAEPLVRHAGLTWRAARKTALALLTRVQVTDPQERMNQFPHELSGGMRQRVMIAGAIACHPSLLIADEPTTALDVTIQAQILALLAELKREKGMSMVLITHDLAAVAGIADRVAVIRAGAILEIGSVGAIFKAPTHEYTRFLLDALPRVGHEQRQGLPGIARPPGTARPPWTAGPPGTARPRGPDGQAALAVSDLRVSFPVRAGWPRKRRVLRALDGVSLELRSGESLGVVGESGSGKSTLARAIVQLIRPQSGRTVWSGRSLEALSRNELRALRASIQIVFQDPWGSLDPRMSASEIVEEPLRVHRRELGRKERTLAVSDALERVGLSPQLGNRYPHELSGGQCQRIGIARAMVLQPQLLICDEPMGALDVTVQAQILQLLSDLKQQLGLSILLISHNLAVVRRLCERVLVLYLGRMMELSPSEILFSQPRHPYARELLESAPIPDPAVQPERLTRGRSGEAPSPLSPPSGCVYRTRCPHAIDICRERVPEWDACEEGHAVACHRWRELAGP